MNEDSNPQRSCPDHLASPQLTASIFSFIGVEITCLSRCSINHPALPGCCSKYPHLATVHVSVLLRIGAGGRGAMTHDVDASSVPYLQVYKDGQLVDTVCLQGRDRWIAGRHADCHIWVGHASTSRRHLEIQVLHATQELLLLDLHSGMATIWPMHRSRVGSRGSRSTVTECTMYAAHGTRVNGEAVTSGSSVVVKQDDTVQMGASTRSYRVDWVQSSEAGASVLERSSPNGSKASFRYKLGNIQVHPCNSKQKCSLGH